MHVIHAAQVQLLRKLRPVVRSDNVETPHVAIKDRLPVVLGNYWNSIEGKTIIDFGCGHGHEAVAMALRGARVIALDINPEALRYGRELAAKNQVKVDFQTSTNEKADLVVSLDAFEHFLNPHEILRTMASLLKPDGTILISFGPTWYHPKGGHIFSIFPWSHLFFGEKALMQWFGCVRDRVPTGFEDVGLNKMSVKKFVRMVEESKMTIKKIELVPIRKLKFLHCRSTREFTTATVRAELTH